MRFRRRSESELDELEDEFPSDDEMLGTRLCLRFAGLPDDVGEVLEVSTNEK